MSELLNYNAFLEITLVNLTKIKCQLISINAKDSSGEIKVKNINGDTITIDILDIYAVTQGITFLRVDKTYHVFSVAIQFHCVILFSCQQFFLKKDIDFSSFQTREHHRSLVIFM